MDAIRSIGWWCIISLLPAWIASSQVPPLVFEKISVEQGLSQSIVTSIIQDSRGFLWFATEDGLNLYDGYSFTVLRSDPSDSTSLSYNQISCIYEDRNGMIWVGTYSGGLNRYVLRKNRFVRYRSNLLDPATIASDLINVLVSDRNGALWVGTDRGLTRISTGEPGTWNNPRVVRFHAARGDPAALPDNSIRSLCLDSTGALWIGTDAGLALLPKEELASESPRFTRFAHDARDPASLSQDTVRVLYTDPAGALWVGTDGGLNLAVRSAPGGPVRGFRRFVPHEGDPFALNHPRVFSLLRDRNGILWVGTDGGGLNRLDMSTGQFFHYLNDPRNPQSLSYNEIRSISEDRSGLLWVGTYGGGVNKVDARKKPFLLVRSDPNNNNSLNQDIVWAIYEDPGGILWIGTHGGGLNMYDRTRNRFRHFRSDPANPATLSSDYVRLVIGDPSGDLWIGTNGGGICRFDPRTERFRRFLHDPADTASLSHNEIRSLYLDRDGKLWIGTLGGGLNVLDTHAPGRPQFRHYRHDPGDSSSIGADIVREICPDQSGFYWIATQGGGLNRFDPRSGRFTRYRNVPEDPASLASDFVMGVHCDREGVLWASTWGGGLNRFDPHTGKIRRFSRADGLPGNGVYGILEDHNGNFWLSTNRGLSRFNPRTLTVRNYSMRDGLQNNEFNAGAYFQSVKGEMFFGGIGGFNAFFPDSILDNPNVPPVVITAFRKLSREVRFDQPVSEVEEISLSYRDYYFSFEFAALDYTAPEKNQYAYMLEGLDEDWITTSPDKRFAQYTTLKPGTYVFHVKGSNNDGIWNTDGVRVRLVITPPFWEAWWFRLAVVGGIGLIGALLYLRRLRTVRMKAELRAAHDMQMSIMPHGDPDVPGCDLAGICLPASEVGGDFFDYLWLGDDQTSFGVAVGDVSGKAMRAAMMAVMVSGMVNAEAASCRGVGEILRRTNRLLYPKVDRRAFTALALLVLDPDRRSVRYANAGLVRPILISRGNLCSLEARGSPHALGMVPDPEYEETTQGLRPGDVLVVTTDGVTEAQDGRRRLYGEEGLHAVLRSLDLATLSARQIVEAIVADVRRFSGSAPQFDDLTVVVLKIDNLN